MGFEKATVQNLEIAKVDAAKNLILVKGAVPGANKSLVIINESKKTKKAKGGK